MSVFGLVINCNETQMDCFVSNKAYKFIDLNNIGLRPELESSSGCKGRLLLPSSSSHSPIVLTKIKGTGVDVECDKFDTARLFLAIFLGSTTCTHCDLLWFHASLAGIICITISRNLVKIGIYIFLAAAGQ